MDCNCCRTGIFDDLCNLYRINRISFKSNTDLRCDRFLYCVRNFGHDLSDQIRVFEKCGTFAIIDYYSGFRAGFCFSAGATDLVFSASLPAAAKTWMIIPLGIAAFVVFYAVFYFAITKFDLKTPGREDEDEEAEKKVVLANNNYTEVASAVLAAVGGKENVKEVGYCATRLRFEVKDNAKVDEKAVKAAGAAGVIRPSKNACQVIIGTKVQFVYDELKKML